jgi:hypothetical protein
MSELRGNGSVCQNAPGVNGGCVTASLGMHACLHGVPVGQLQSMRMPVKLMLQSRLSILLCASYGEHC